MVAILKSWLPHSSVGIGGKYPHWPGHINEKFPHIACYLLGCSVQGENGGGALPEVGTGSKYLTFLSPELLLPCPICDMTWGY